MRTAKFFSKAANRHYILPKETVESFMALPPEKRAAVWGYTRILKDGEVEMTRIGNVVELADLGHNVEAVVALDMSREGAKLAATLLDSNKQLICGLAGYGHVDENGAVMEVLKYVVISPPEDVPQ